MPREKLIILSFDYPPSNGGIARLCGEITNRMQLYYNHIHVITVKRPENYSFLKNEKTIYTFLPSKRIKSEWLTFKTLVKIKNKKDYDVLCGLWHPEAFLAFLSGFKSVNILGHGTEFLSGTSKFRKFFWLPIYGKWILKRAKVIIANSNYTKSLITQIQHKAKVKALPLGVNEDFFKPRAKKTQNNTFNIASLSRIQKFKGYDIVFEALLGLEEKYRSKIQWNIGGKGPYLEEFKGRITKSFLAKQVIFNGFIPDEELPAFYQKNDLFVLMTQASGNSTQVEGFGLVFLEAQSCGIPVIGANTGGIPDAIKHENGGWLVEQNDIEAFQQILISCIENPKNMILQKKKARERVLNESTWQLYCEGLIKIIRG